MNLYIYEDQQFGNFTPLSLTRPVFLMRPGIRPIYQRIMASFEYSQIGFCVREQMASVVSAEARDIPVNIIKHDSDILLINGRLRSAGNISSLISKSPISTLFYIKGSQEIAGVLIKQKGLADIPAISEPSIFEELISKNRTDWIEAECTATLYNYCWEIMDDIEPSLVDDIRLLAGQMAGPSNTRIGAGVQFYGNERDIVLGDSVEILPTALLDATAGPIHIGANSRIEGHVSIYGPCHIGPNTTILAGKITSSSIGHTCKVGGEVENSVFHSYVNKAHDGFIGHSYVGSWVNFGAMTTNSDLKNNYSSIKLTVNGESIDSLSIKVGSFIGDHTKFGIGTLLNTGINIGVSSNIFGGVMIADKEVESFSWGNSGNWQKYDLDRAIETARKVCDRRQVRMSPGEIELLTKIHGNATTDKGIIRIPNSQM